MFYSFIFILFFFNQVKTKSIVSINREANKIIKYVNNIPNNTWKAGFNFKSKQLKEIENIMGVLPINEKYTQSLEDLGFAIHHNSNNILDKDFNEIEVLPENFDASKQWSKCKSILSVKNQSNCGSCWALSTASVFSDRICIATNGSIDNNLSGEYLLSCCTGSCGRGCNGGHPEKAWKFIINNGICTGGDYGSNEGCQPYSIAPSAVELSFENTADTPECYHTCTNPHYTTPLQNDLYFASKVYTVKPKMKPIMYEIYKNGPVVAAMKTYEDFFHYKSGIYQYKTGSSKGDHAIKLIGWGEENGMLYWLAVNTWGTLWGMDGIFKIKRGSNECGIESRISGGLPKL
ncbi:cathepsin B-like cysteine proteinase 4 [Daktulosphaira vitifoliae]|uniref:cathepsin B-like cysteine proteinase 4 n=1 Tax=Daktulosphaira vitifoliae TaxID=58002 RepID=UPI0021A9A1A9|nr:cathepsin B-like cysteine proteinase 4 [Daktulosphaira vitifoliae]